MFDLINEMCELIYVVDIETYDLLFVNRTGKDKFGIEDLAGLKCYRALQGREQPCEFCTNTYLKEHEFYSWEYTNPVVQRHYLLKDKLIDWNGKKARVEIAFDITDGENEKINLRNSLEAESLVTECAQHLFGNAYEDNRIETVLQKAGEFLEADRAYIFEIQDDSMSNTYEWCASGVAPQIRHLQKMPVTLIDRWRGAFDQQKCVLIENLENIRCKSPQEYQVLKRQGIHSLIAAPIYSNNSLSGYIGVDNHAIQKLVNASAILRSIGYFIGAMLQNMRSMAMLEQLSYYDTLTELGNRNKFNWDIGRPDMGCDEGMGIVYLDINGMKRINDERGHYQGDVTLIRAAKKIKEIFPEDYAYRIGGDEFVVICAGVSEEQFEHRVRELLLLFMAEKDYSVSVGRYWSGDSRDIRELLFRADEQMYNDKKKFYRGKALSGRYRHGLDDVLNMTKPGKLEQMIREHKFPVYFQPKINSMSHEMIGSEALVRCEISPGKVMPPDKFIPVLEESRLISMLDFYVFRQVNARIWEWLQNHKPVCPVSVNFSRYTLSEHNFLAKLQEIWSVYEVPKHLVEIEVTETVEEDDSYNFIELLKEIKKEGFFISIDDFGIKNANLSLFTSMDFDILKIDKSLVQNLVQNEKAQAVLASISDICRKMGIKMIVEGVENQEQLTILQRLRCDGIQGFLFSRPLPLKDFEERYMQNGG